MAPPKFKDISKSANDLMNNDYCFDQKFKLKSKTSNGVELTSELTMKPKGVNAKLTSKFTPFQGISVDKLCVTTAGRFITEATLKDAMEGVSLKVKAEDGASMAPAGELCLDYKADNAIVNLSVDVVEGPTLKGATAFSYEGFVLGGELKYNTSFDTKDAKASLEDYNAGIAYKGADYTASVSTKKKATQYNVAVHHKVSKDVEVATTYAHSSKLLGIGGIYKFDDATKFQGKVNSQGIVSANVIQQIRPKVKLIASAQVDAKNFVQDSHKFGLQLILG
jgi:voltage-dependent anion channel protein 2